MPRVCARFRHRLKLGYSNHKLTLHAKFLIGVMFRLRLPWIYKQLQGI